jgi:hypothetical protein
MLCRQGKQAISGRLYRPLFLGSFLANHPPRNRPLQTSRAHRKKHFLGILFVPSQPRPSPVPTPRPDATVPAPVPARSTPPGGATGPQVTKTYPQTDSMSSGVDLWRQEALSAVWWDVRGRVDRPSDRNHGT